MSEDGSREDVLRSWNFGLHSEAYKVLAGRVYGGGGEVGMRSLGEMERENDLRVARMVAEGGETWGECRDGYLGLVEKVKEVMGVEGER